MCNRDTNPKACRTAFEICPEFRSNSAKPEMGEDSAGTPQHSQTVRKEGAPTTGDEDRYQDVKCHAVSHAYVQPTNTVSEQVCARSIAARPSGG